jgi:hypothetical protein
MPSDFDVREWAHQHNVTLPVNDPDVRAQLTTLFRRDLTPARIATYVGSRQSRPDRTSRQNQGCTEYSDGRLA